MHTGMLWFDNSKNTLAQKIQRAADHFQKKYGRRPDMCLVHPSLLESGNGSPGLEEGGVLKEVDGVLVRPYRPVLPGHLWIGVEDGPVEVPQIAGDD